MGSDKIPDWLTDMDEEILEALSKDLVLSPSIIAENIDRSREGVSNRLSTLQAGGLVEKVDRGKYELTDEGESVMLAARGLSDAERIGTILTAKKIEEEIEKLFGVSGDEYDELVEREYEKIQEEEPDCEQPFLEARDRVEERLREENPYFERAKEE